MITKRNSVSIPLLGIAFVIILAACSKGEGGSTVIMTGTMGLGTLTPTDAVPSLYTSTGSPTSIITPTNSNTQTPALQPGISPTKTSITPSYMLKDWREPTEVITPENIDRVEKIGELDFTENVFKFAWSPDGSRFGASLVNTGAIFILDPFTFKTQWSLIGTFAAFSYDGLILETGDYQYDMATGKRLETGGKNLTQYPGGISDIEFSPNGEYIASAGSEYIQIYPMKNGIKEGQFGRYVWDTWHVSISPDSKIIAVNSPDENFTELWDPYQQQPKRIFKMKDISGQGKPRFLKDGKSLLFTGNGTWDEKEVTFLQEWDYISGKPLYVQVIPEFNMLKGASIDISPISNVIALGTIGKIYLLPMQDCRAIQIGKSKQSKYGIYNIAFRPDGKLFATLEYSDNTIELWGIPASGESTQAIGPTEEESETPVVCPKIPMEVEYPTPKYDWWGGGRPHG